MTTAEPHARPDARPARPGVSVRLRLTAAVALLVALALTGAGMIVYLVEGQRLQEQMGRQVDQDVAELAKLRRDGVDPATGRPFRGVASLLDSYLSRSVPADDEVLVTWYDDRAQQVSASSDSHARDLAASPLFDRTVRSLLATNGSREIDVPSYGRARVTVQAVRGERGSGALVVVTYLEEGRAGLLETMRTYAVVSSCSTPAARRTSPRPASCSSTRSTGCRGSWVTCWCSPRATGPTSSPRARSTSAGSPRSWWPRPGGSATAGGPWTPSR